MATLAKQLSFWWEHLEQFIPPCNKRVIHGLVLIPGWPHSGHSEGLGGTTTTGTPRAGPSLGHLSENKSTQCRCQWHHCGHGRFTGCWLHIPLFGKTVPLTFRFSELLGISVSFQPPSNEARSSWSEETRPITRTQIKKQKCTNKEIKSLRLSAFLGLWIVLEKWYRVQTYRNKHRKWNP